MGELASGSARAPVSKPKMESSWEHAHTHGETQKNSNQQDKSSLHFAEFQHLQDQVL